MKFLIAIALATATAACAAPQTHVNVAVVRDDIKGVIDHDKQNPREIVGMGHTTYESAVVYTKSNGQRHEESWAHNDQGWTLTGTKDLTASN